MKKTLIVLLAALIAVSVFAGGAQESASAGTGAVREHFVAGIDTMPTTFNPGSNTAPVLNDLVYDMLIHYNKVTAEFEPGLAVAWRWVDNDAKILHLDLRKGVTFQNGNPFTAADVDYSLANCANVNIGSYYDYSTIYDDYSLDIHLKSGNADFVSVLSNTLYAGIVDKESCEADPANGAAVGTGPWKIDLVNTVPGDTIELVRYDGYWGQVPETKYLTLRYIKSNSSRLIALQNDEIQAMMTVGETDVNTVKNDPVLEYCTGAGVGPAKLYYISFNMKNGALKDNVYLRQAVACVMNRANIIALSGDAGAVESNGIFWGYDTAYRASLSDCKEDLSLNVEKAKELVEKGKALNGGTLPTIRLTANTSKSINMTMCLEVIEECRQIGLNVELEETDSAGIISRTHYDHPDFDMVQYNVPLESWASAVNRMLVPNSINNRAILDDPYVTERLYAAAATTDSAKRAELYRDVQVYVHDNAIYIPAYYGSRDGAQRKGVSGIVWTNDGYPEFKYAKVTD